MYNTVFLEFYKDDNEDGKMGERLFDRGDILESVENVLDELVNSEIKQINIAINVQKEIDQEETPEDQDKTYGEAIEDLNADLHEMWLAWLEMLKEKLSEKRSEVEKFDKEECLTEIKAEELIIKTLTSAIKNMQKENS